MRAVPHLKNVHCLSQLAWGWGFRRAWCCGVFIPKRGLYFLSEFPLSPWPSGRKGLETQMGPLSAFKGSAILGHSGEEFLLPVFCGSVPCFSYYLGLNLNVTPRWWVGVWREQHSRIFQLDAHFLVPQKDLCGLLGLPTSSSAVLKWALASLDAIALWPGHIAQCRWLPSIF